MTTPTFSSSKIERVPFDEMSAGDQERHKIVHGLIGKLWKDGSDRWEKTFGKKTWKQVHEEDHQNYPRDFAHIHVKEMRE